MKYKVVNVYEDNEILNQANDYEIAKMIGCTPTYVNRVRRGVDIATFEFYQRLRKALTK